MPENYKLKDGTVVAQTLNLTQAFSGEISCVGCYFHKKLVWAGRELPHSDPFTCGKYEDPALKMSLRCGGPNEPPGKQFIFVEVPADESG